MRKTYTYLQYCCTSCLEQILSTDSFGGINDVPGRMFQRVLINVPRKRCFKGAGLWFFFCAESCRFVGFEAPSTCRCEAENVYQVRAKKFSQVLECVPLKLIAASGLNGHRCWRRTCGTPADSFFRCSLLSLLADAYYRV